MTARLAWTYQDYAALPDDGKRYEIHDGELSETPAPTSLHQIVLANLFRIVDAHVRAGNLGLVLFAPLDVILSERLSETTILQPDLILPYLWLVDPDARAVDAFVRDVDQYTMAVRASGAQPVDLPPITDLGLVPASLWG